ncbi:MAG: hypothetical protein KDB79_17155 [Acidobacteria bacterium]|nr:hypothetical protein [Acidobacteriota bacterium]
MNEIERKKKLLDQGLKQVEVAEAMVKEFGITKDSAVTIVSKMITGAGWYPVYAKWLNDKYGIIIPRPAWLETGRTRMKRAA